MVNAAMKDLYKALKIMEKGGDGDRAVLLYL